MSLIIQKYGGSSVASIAQIKHVARKIKATQQAGHQVVVVVSAMGDETDRLESLALALTAEPNGREMDVLLATGEQVSIALLSIALQSLGCQAKSYTGYQLGILSDAAHTRARIHAIDDGKIRSDLAQGIIVVVAGFQGVDLAGDITTLGRGGSDTTAVALAAALGADECQIYTDVDGVYNADPRVISTAKKMPEVGFEAMLEFSSLGATVLQNRAVELAGKYQVPLRVLSTFTEGPGTLIRYGENKAAGIEHPVIAGLAFSREEARLTIHGIVNKPGVMAAIIAPLTEANISIDMLGQSLSKAGEIDVSFSLPRRDYERAWLIGEKIAAQLEAQGIIGDKQLAKLSLVGIGMRSHASLGSTVFRVLGEEGINIQLISSSEIKVSVLVDEKHLEQGLKSLHQAFAVHNLPLDESYEEKRRSA